MTRTALSKLNEKQLEHLRKMSVAIARVRDCEDEYDKELFDYRTGGLHGYLKCLADMDIITESEKNLLFAYFK